MPELPEVETLRDDLERQVVGAVVEHIQITGPRVVRRHVPQEVVDGLRGATVVGTWRLGKFMGLDLDSAKRWMIHLRMSGQLRLFRDAEAPMAAHTHAIAQLGNGAQLRFIDPRTFGEMWMTTTSSRPPELRHLGPDALSESQHWDLAARLRSRRGSLKALLMNQSFLAGIGNIYSDEILWRAGIDGSRSGSSLTRGQVVALEKATVEVIDWAVELRGSTLSDGQYVDLFGRSGRASEAHCVYGRHGQACPRCQDPIVRIRIGSRGTYLCPRCQR